jgi:hypothetical protein
MGDAQNCAESDLGLDFIGTLVPNFSPGGRHTAAIGCRAPSADERTATPSEPGDERARRRVYQLRCGSSSWTLPTRGSPSGPCSVTSA